MKKYKFKTRGKDKYFCDRNAQSKFVIVEKCCRQL